VIMFFIMIVLGILKLFKLVPISWLVVFSPILIIISFFVLLFGLVGTIDIVHRVYKSAIGYDRKG